MGDIEWPTGQEPLQVKMSSQVKRKLENPDYRTVTATLVHTENGAKIVVQGIDDPSTTLTDDQKNFIRLQVKEVVLQEIAISKTWGKIPSVQATFQLGTGM
jgi:acyl-CoA synthetase (NDP forming)